MMRLAVTVAIHPVANRNLELAMSYLGVSTQYQVEAQGGVRLTVYEQNVERATRAELWGRGEAVRLTWSPDHSFVVAEGDATGPGGTGSAGEGAPASTTSTPA